MKTIAYFLLGFTPFLTNAQSTHSSENLPIVINELFPDPTPSVGLPEKEFIELFNTSTDTVPLKGYKLTDSLNSCVLPDFLMPPHTFLILCSKTDTAFYNKFGPTLGLSGIIHLNNDKEEVYLYSPTGIEFQKVKYAKKDYKEGCTLELKGSDFNCHQSFELVVSKDPKGGTPGNKNFLSFDAINNPFIIQEFSIMEGKFMEIKFNFPIVPDIPLLNFYIDDQEVSIVASSYNDSLIQLNLTLDFPLQNGQKYNLKIDNIHLCEGQFAVSAERIFMVGEAPSIPDVVINEILFNPTKENEDFLEIINRSEFPVNLKGWKFGSLKDSGNEEEEEISGVDLILPGKSIIVFTPDKTKLMETFPTANPNTIYEVILPSFNDDLGKAILRDNKGLLIDCFSYSEKLHFPLLETAEGISLEKVDFNLSSDIASNWQSAALTAGFGTPGYANSCYRTIDQNQYWEITPLAISPNSDGYNDFVIISYNVANIGSIVSIAIYDVEGRLIKKLMAESTISHQGFLKWDGTDEAGECVNIGQYIFYIKKFSLQGDQEEWKKTVVVTD